MSIYDVSKKRFKELREMLEKALYFFVDNASKQELKEQFEWYNVDNKEDLVDVMFESYLDSYNEEEELIERINYLFELDTYDNDYKIRVYKEFLSKDNNSDLFELKIGVIE